MIVKSKIVEFFIEMWEMIEYILYNPLFGIILNLFAF
jgi:hypothetical protein